jgi:rhodanese-related sulfurtransferase
LTAYGFRVTTANQVRIALVERREIALLDVREEVFHAEGHPLFAANLPLSRLELDAFRRLPRKNVPIVLFDNGEGYSADAERRLAKLGYSDVSLLEDGLQGWHDAGFELFRDVNSPSKAFGELVETRRHTPSLSAREVKELIDAKADIVIVDTRRFDEFQTMSIPTAVSAPGGELVYRLHGLAEKPTTRVIVNCGGRTRSIIGTQSLINAGLHNPVAALRNGTIGWQLAGQSLDRGITREAPFPDAASRSQAASAARRVADAAGVRRTLLGEVGEWLDSATRTVYRFDVRTPAEYGVGHPPNFRSAPGGQLVQETDMFAPVRGARVVLVDNDGVRANMTASWLAQMNWEVYVVDGAPAQEFEFLQDEADELPAPPEIPSTAKISAMTLHDWMRSHSSAGRDVTVLDFSTSRNYLRGHIPNSLFALRSRIEEAVETTAESKAYVVTSHEEASARFAWKELEAAAAKPVYFLDGGIKAWQESGYSIENVPAAFASQPVDYYRRPYEGTDASPASMQAYLDWEFGLVEQLERDGTHGFWVLEPDRTSI